MSRQADSTTISVRVCVGPGGERHRGHGSLLLLRHKYPHAFPLYAVVHGHSGQCTAQSSLSNCLLLPVFTDDEFGEKSVCVLLDGEESELTFVDHPSSEMSVSTALCYMPIISSG
jgi:hypothetical protein